MYLKIYEKTCTINLSYIYIHLTYAKKLKNGN